MIKGEAEAFPIGSIEGREAVLFGRRTAGQTRTLLLSGGRGGEGAGFRFAAPEFGVGPQKRELILWSGPFHRAHQGGVEGFEARKGAPGPGARGHPRRVFEHMAESRHEIPRSKAERRAS